MADKHDVRHPHFLEPSVLQSPTFLVEHEECANVCGKQSSPSAPHGGRGEAGILGTQILSLISYSPFSGMVILFLGLVDECLYFCLPPNHFFFLSLSSSVTASCVYWIFSLCLLNVDESIFRFVQNAQKKKEICKYVTVVTVF